MAGIGFTLQKLFKEEYYTARIKAYLYSSVVAAGPWIAAVVTINIITFISKYLFNDISQRNLFIGTIVYSFVFSQIITSPWQFIITRYISDKLYQKDYKSIKASFIGINKIIMIISILVSIIFYANSQLPLIYRYMAIILFIILSLIWIIMVYLSAIKNYSIISYAYIIGGVISVILTSILYKYNVFVEDYNIASILLFSYVIGMIITYIILLYSFLSNFLYENHNQFEFLKYLSKYPSLFFIGLLYTLGIWGHNLIMWYSNIGLYIYNTYKYSPFYDNAIFLAYITIIPTLVLFMVQIETEFYELYKKYFGLATKNGTYAQIEKTRIEIKNSIFRQLTYTMEIQTIITITLIVLSGLIFPYFNIPLIVRDIFRIASLGALCNIIVLVIILVLLYFEGRKESLLISIIFFVLNTIFTLYFIPKGLEYYGFGYFIGSFITLLIALFILRKYMKDINYNTFGMQPIFLPKEKGIFVKISNKLKYLNENKNKLIIFNIIFYIGFTMFLAIFIN